MPLKLIHGPPNSGRAGLVRRRFVAALERDPILVVPNVDDVFAFERELCQDGAALGGTAMTFGALFRTVATAGGVPPGAELSPAQRLRAISVAVEAGLGRLGPLRRSASRPGFARAFERLLDELQAAGVDPAAVEASAATLEGSAYLSDIATLFAGYAEVRGRTGRVDTHGIAREAIELLRRDGSFWGGRPVFLYGLDDLTPNQLELVEALAALTEVTVALPFEEGNAALAARSRLLGELRERIGVAAETAIEADPANTESALLFHLARGFGSAGAEPRAPDLDLLRLLRSAGVRGEAEAIATEVSKLVAGGADPAQIAIALRDPARRGAAIAAALEANGVATALEAELPVAGTAVGGGLVALLEAEFGSRRASDLLRYLRGPSSFSPGRVDWLERSLRRGRVEDAETALGLWQGEEGEPPRDLLRLREAAGRSAAALSAEVGRLAATMAARPLRGEGDGPPLGPGDGLELRAAGAVADALNELAELGRLAPGPEELAATIAGLEFRVWSGPVEGRVRIASPYRLRAGRFDHVFVGSLQDGEFPRRDRGGDPFLSEAQRGSLGLDPRRDSEAEERYLFGVCLALPRRRLFLSYRDSDENGGAESRSPLLDDVRALLAPPPDGSAPDPVEEAITSSRDLARVVHPLAEAPSEDELARAVAAHGPGADATALLAGVGVDEGRGARIAGRIAAARSAEAAARAPGPLSNPAAIASLAAVPAYGGTTLEGFDVCSYRWFVNHELDPQPLDPVPDPLVQGGLMHEALDRLYKERPGGDALPRPGSLAAWLGRGREIVAAVVAERELGSHPAERAMARRVERLLERFLAEEAGRETGGFEPWLLEASFGIGEEDSERPALELDGWGLHGAIDRVDRAADGRALVIDYKLSGSVTAREKFEEQAKLQLPLYLLAVAKHWGAEPVGGLYHPLRGTSVRRPRGVVVEEAAEDLADYGLYSRDVVDAQGLEELLADSRRRGGEIVARMRVGDIRRDPGPRRGLRGHNACPPFCTFAPICRRDRAPEYEEDVEVEER
ncbi:MAG TPA: PD-(D/E)XK nuclease family protein [Solirubrobacterales bacterium]|jgi:ATP-dependent helicase/DNAse subunit B|nr:PD-(D/E)XK nuclease family protein [Solirubrobacterales bacterium]